MKFKTRKYAVWPVPTPDNHHDWSQARWNKYENKFRPKDYFGGRYQVQAWGKYLAKK